MRNNYVEKIVDYLMRKGFRRDFEVLDFHVFYKDMSEDKRKVVCFDLDLTYCVLISEDDEASVWRKTTICKLMNTDDDVVQLMAFVGDSYVSENN